MVYFTPYLTGLVLWATVLGLPCHCIYYRKKKLIVQFSGVVVGQTGGLWGSSEGKVRRGVSARALKRRCGIGWKELKKYVKSSYKQARVKSMPLKSTNKVLIYFFYRLIVYYGPYHLYIVKFKKRPTKHCGLTRHRLLPFEHCFEVLTC